MRGDIERMNDTLLRYRLRGDPADAEAFHNDTLAFGNWLANGAASATTPLERNLFEKAATAYEGYLAEGTRVLEASRARWQSTQARDFQDSYEKVQAQSQVLLGLCDTFIVEQRAAFDGFLQESKVTASVFQRLLQLSLALLLTLAAALVVLVYRGMIAPLRYRLTESQAIIARQEKLASLGVLAAGVAHEIRNPLTAIKFRLFSLKNTLPAAGSGNEDAVVIGSEISRLERIVEDFLQFARPSEPELVTIPAQRIMQDVHDLLQPQLEKSAIQLKVEASEHIWARADTQQIKQVLINLIQNSADSIGRKGVISLRVRKEPGSARKGTSAAVILQVADNGKEIPPEVQRRLFDPFFTTKEGGTGLGLPIAARIVEKHGGELRYETELNRGTTFSVVLHAADEHES
jgi:signal transduction histidine kinase